MLSEVKQVGICTDMHAREIFTVPENINKN